MKVFSGLFLFLLMTIACNVSNDKKTPPEFIFKAPYIIDTFNIKRGAENKIWLDYEDYPPLYIGKNKDSVFISKNPYGENNPIQKYFYSSDERGNYKHPKSKDIKLIIDTTRTILYHSFPLFVINASKDTLEIASGVRLSLIHEALDNDGHWRTIDRYLTHMCGTGLSGLFLPPSEMIITTAPIYSGKFQTRLRFRCDSVFSNEYMGTINLTQFESAYDENGNKKPIPEENK